MRCACINATGACETPVLPLLTTGSHASSNHTAASGRHVLQASQHAVSTRHRSDASYALQQSLPAAASVPAGIPAGLDVSALPAAGPSAQSAAAPAAAAAAAAQRMTQFPEANARVKAGHDGSRRSSTSAAKTPTAARLGPHWRQPTAPSVLEPLASTPLQSQVQQRYSQQREQGSQPAWCSKAQGKVSRVECWVNGRGIVSGVRLTDDVGLRQPTICTADGPPTTDVTLQEYESVVDIRACK